MKLASTVKDLYDDPEGDLLKQASAEGLPIPEFVLSADPTPPGDVPEDLFAYHDGVTGKYACDTPAMTWTSSLYFLSEGYGLPKTAQCETAAKIAGFFEVHGIQDHLPDALVKVAAGEMTLQPPGEPEVDNLYALEKEARYPINTVEQVARAQEYFGEYYPKFSPAQRREYCAKVASRARELEVPVDALVGRYASDEVYTEMAEAELLLRAKTAQRQGDEDGARAYVWLADNLGSLGVEKLAETITNLDVQTGMHYLWDTRLRDPYRAILKEAADESDEVVYEGHKPLTAADVRRLSGLQHKVAEVFDPDFARELALDPVVVFSSLPKEDKRILANIIHSGR